MVTIGLIGPLNVGKNKVLREFKEWLVNFSEDFKLTYYERKDDTKIIGTRVMFRKIGFPRINHVLFSFGGNIDDSLDYLGIEAIGSVPKKVIAVFSGELNIEKQLEFYEKTRRFLPKNVYVFLNKILDEDNVVDYKSKINSFFNQKGINIRDFFSIKEKNSDFPLCRLIGDKIKEILADIIFEVEEHKDGTIILTEFDGDLMEPWEWADVSYIRFNREGDWKYLEILDKLLEKMPVAYWIESLPFPLASILWRYISDSNIEHKVENLLKFFEATSVFLATIILSSFHAHTDFYQARKEVLIIKDPKYRDWFKTPSFGNWNSLCRILSKALRTCLDDLNMRENNLKSLRLSLEFTKMLSEKKLYSILEQVAKWRNLWSGHGGIPNERELESRLSHLEKSLEEIREIFKKSFNNNIKLIKSITMQKNRERYYHQVENIVGTRTPFKREEIELLSELDREKLYLFDKNSKSNLAIELLPFIRIMSSPSQEKNACYFYNRMINDQVRWVSYHFSEESERIDGDKELTEALSILSVNEN